MIDRIRRGEYEPSVLPVEVPKGEIPLLLRTAYDQINEAHRSMHVSCWHRFWKDAKEELDLNERVGEQTANEICNMAKEICKMRTEEVDKMDVWNWIVRLSDLFPKQSIKGIE